MTGTSPTRGDLGGRVVDGVVGPPRFHVVAPSTSPAASPPSSVARVAPLPSDPGPLPAADETRASMRAASRSFVTVLFTDLVDSTRRAVELGDHRWLALHGSHEAMTVRAVRRFRGRVLQLLGDGVLATFPSAMAGALCAARIVETSRDFGLDVRAGLHAGECERRERRLGGLVFHVGARIVGLAGPGEVLMSQTVSALLLGSGLACRPQGCHELRGLAGAWEVWRLESRARDLA